MTIQNILGLDPATKCGWSMGATIGGVWDCSIRRDESGGMRLLRFKAKLVEIHKATPINLIAYEAARHAAPGMGGALVTQATLQGVLLLWATENDIPYRPYSPTEVKKYATGKGNSGKPAMLAAADIRWPGIRWVDDNHVDATFIWQMAAEDYTGL